MEILSKLILHAEFFLRESAMLPCSAPPDFGEWLDCQAQINHDIEISDSVGRRDSSQSIFFLRRDLHKTRQKSFLLKLSTTGTSVYGEESEGAGSFHRAHWGRSKNISEGYSVNVRVGGNPSPQTWGETDPGWIFCFERSIQKHINLPWSYLSLYRWFSLSCDTSLREEVLLQDDRRSGVWCSRDLTKGNVTETKRNVFRLYCRRVQS